MTKKKHSVSSSRKAKGKFPRELIFVGGFLAGIVTLFALSVNSGPTQQADLLGWAKKAPDIATSITPPANPTFGQKNVPLVIQLKNIGKSDAKVVVMTFVARYLTNLRLDKPVPGCMARGSNVLCTISNIAPGKSVDIALHADVASDGKRCSKDPGYMMKETLKANLVVSPSDSNPRNNSGEVSYSISCPTACANGVDDDKDGLTDFPNDPGCMSLTDTKELGENNIEIVKTGSPVTVLDVITQYQITVTNRGPDPALAPVVITDIFPNEFRFFSDLSSNECILSSDGTVKCTVSTLQVNAPTVLTLSFVVPDNASLCYTTKRNLAQVTNFPEKDTDLLNNESVFETTFWCPEMNCSNGMDDDTDGVTDCSDTDCADECPVCGDGIIYPQTEECDDGKQCEAIGGGITDCTSSTAGCISSSDCAPRNGDGCSAVCMEEECGNGVQDPQEQCDDGRQCTGDQSVQCHTDSDCSKLARCLRGPDGMSHCPDGSLCTQSSDCHDTCQQFNGDGCSNNCQIEGICGDGSVTGSETCDPADHRSCPTDTVCNATCTACETVGFCGNGIVESNEQCDPGATCANGTSCNPSGPAQQCADGSSCTVRCTDGSCSTNCRVPACLNGTLECGEACEPDIHYACEGSDNPCDPVSNDPATGMNPACTTSGVCSMDICTNMPWIVCMDDSDCEVPHACIPALQDPATSCCSLACEPMNEDMPGCGGACVMDADCGSPDLCCVQGANGQNECTPCPSPEICNDAIDNDGDFLIDCSDYNDCYWHPYCGGSIEICTNGIDDDSDWMTDCSDTDCYSDPACQLTPQCSDGIDNDADARVDQMDSGCLTSTGVYNPNDNDEANGSGETQCNDGIDNDSNGRVDCFDCNCYSTPICGPSSTPPGC